MGTGLFLVRIDHLREEQYANKHKLGHLLIQDGDVEPQHSPSSEEEHPSNAYMGKKRGAEKKDQAPTLPPRVLDAETLVISCGALNYESTSFSTKQSKSFSKLIGDTNKPTKKYTPYDLSQEHQRDTFLQSFKKS